MNTCGWVDGFGAVMLQEILKQLPRQTTQIIQLSSAKPFEVDLGGFWVTQVKGDLAETSQFQKGSTMRNKRIWDYISRRSARLVESRPYAYGGKLDVNLQLVACLKEDDELSWIGFVTDINKKTGEIMIASQTEQLTQG